MLIGRSTTSWGKGDSWCRGNVSNVVTQWGIRIEKNKLNIEKNPEIRIATSVFRFEPVDQGKIDFLKFILNQ